jgi:hypothetical protein
VALELDHVFICVDDAAEAERTLGDGGVQIGLRAIHTGQGTANACAFSHKLGERLDLDDAISELHPLAVSARP